jgi:stalled ribosome alternative rescue factor ArfA
MKKKRKTRNPMAGVLAQPCFKKLVVQNKKAYSRKGKRAVRKQFHDGSFFIKTKSDT